MPLSQSMCRVWDFEHDTLIAGIALRHQATLVTRNVREFSRVPELQCLNWHEGA